MIWVLNVACKTRGHYISTNICYVSKWLDGCRTKIAHQCSRSPWGLASCLVFLQHKHQIRFRRYEHKYKVYASLNAFLEILRPSLSSCSRANLLATSIEIQWRERERERFQATWIFKNLYSQICSYGDDDCFCIGVWGWITCMHAFFPPIAPFVKELAQCWTSQNFD